MSTVTRDRDERKPRKPPSPPRPPLSWRLSAEPVPLLVIENCDAVAQEYRVLPFRSDFGRAWTLVKLGHEFGRSYDVLLDDSGHWLCSCPGNSYRGVCKHCHSLSDLYAKGILP